MVRHAVEEDRIEQFGTELRGDLTRPEMAEYDDARAVWNWVIDKYPALIARCRGVADVVSAVGFAREKGLPVSVRGGGHNVATASLHPREVACDSWRGRVR